MSHFDILLYNIDVKKKITLLLVLMFLLAYQNGSVSDVYAADEHYNPVYYACEQIDENSPLKGKCQECGGELHGEPEGLWTAFGCISTDPVEMIKTGVYIGISIAGGVGMISIIIAGLLYSISTGDPKRTTQAKELMTSALIGILFIIFSVTILRFIAGDLMHVPGFAV